MKIRDERPDDIAAIRSVHEESFPTTMEAGIVDVLRDAGRLTISLVAEEGGRVVGHVAFSPVTIDGAEVGLGLGPVAVLSEFRGRGVAGRMIREGLRKCSAIGRKVVVVVGQPEYYARFGFRAASGYGLHDEFGAGEAFQVLELSTGSLGSARGLVCYSPEFREANG